MTDSRKRPRVFLPVFLCVLALWTAYVLLDTFVIERRIETAAAAQTVSMRNAEEKGEPAASQPPLRRRRTGERSPP